MRVLAVPRIKTGRRFPRSFMFLVAAAFLAAPAQAAFIDTFPLDKFSLFNDQADGSVITNDGWLSLIFTGGNDGSGLAGLSDLTAVADQAGTVRYQYSYSTLDDPAFDTGGFLLNGVFSPLVDFQGIAMFPVMVGDTFGFRITTLDNGGEPGVLTVSLVSEPGQAIPEPSYFVFAFLVVGAAIARPWLSRRNRRSDQEAA